MTKKHSKWTKSLGPTITGAKSPITLALLLLIFLGFFFVSTEIPNIKHTAPMRTLKAKDFLKIVTGNDLEFRMTSYAFRLAEDVSLHGVSVAHNFTFKGCKFKEVHLDDVSVTGSLTFEDCELKSLEVVNSDFSEIAVSESRMDSLHICGNEAIGSLSVDGSMINRLEVRDNKRFERLHVGCANEIQKALLTSNGFKNEQGDQSSVYLCPERFNHLEIDRLNSGRVEFGTFGEFAHMRVNELTAAEVKLENCSNAKSDVLFTNIRPKSEKGTKFSIANSTIGPEVFADGEIKKFDQFSVENSSITDELLMLNHINQRKRGNFSSKLASFLFFTW